MIVQEPFTTTKKRCNLINSILKGFSRLSVYLLGMGMVFIKLRRFERFVEFEISFLLLKTLFVDKYIYTLILTNIYYCMLKPVQLKQYNSPSRAHIFLLLGAMSYENPQIIWRAYKMLQDDF